MNSNQVYLDTEEGVLILCEGRGNADTVDVFRYDSAGQKSELGFMLSSNLNTSTLRGKLTDSEHAVLILYLAEVRELRGVRHYAEMLAGGADELTASRIMDPADNQELQQIAGLLWAILERGGFLSEVFDASPSAVVRNKIPAAAGFRWSSLVDVGDDADLDQDAINPFEQTPEQSQFLDSIEKAQKGDFIC